MTSYQSDETNFVKNENINKDIKLEYKDMPTFNTKMNTHDLQNHKDRNIRIHQDLLATGYLPIVSSTKSKSQLGRYKLKYDNEIKHFQTKYTTDVASDESDYKNKEYEGREAADRCVGLLLDGKLALVDFDDVENPELWRAFEEKFAFLKTAHKDKNPNKEWSFHYLIPDEVGLCNNMDVGTITGQKGTCTNGCEKKPGVAACANAVIKSI